MEQRKNDNISITICDALSYSVFPVREVDHHNVLTVVALVISEAHRHACLRLHFVLTFNSGCCYGLVQCIQ
jgi:hypothetical protein